MAATANMSDLQGLNVGSALPAQQFECAAGPEEDWTGTVDPKTRRKLQNRLNQRAYRRRKLTDRIVKARDTTTVLQVSPAVQLSPSSSSSNSSSNLEDDEQVEGTVTSSNPTKPALDNWLKRFNQTTSNKEVAVHRNSFHRRTVPAAEMIHTLKLMQGTPGSDHLLLTLIQFNVIRAFISNLKWFKLPLYSLMNEETLSPFTTSSIVPENLPPALQPTVSQIVYPHHPYIDLFPDPKARDNMIEALTQDMDEDLICEEMAMSSEGNGLIVWGPAERIESWEVTEGFAGKYSWLLKGCADLQRATNRWREARGDEPLRFQEVDD